MTTYIFSGRVFPERSNFTMSAPQKLKVQVPGANLDFEATLSIANSQVSVSVESAALIRDVHSLKNHVKGLVRTAVDALAYLEGGGYDVEITSVVGPGPFLVFDVEEPTIQASKSERPVTFQELWALLAPILGQKSTPLQRVLADLRESIREPGYTSFSCFRAVESLRQSFVEAGDGDKTAPSWNRLREALRIDRSWVDPLTELSKPLRHGEAHFSSAQERGLAMRLAWKVVDRFVEYARRGYQPLPASEFELLKHS